MVPPPTPSSKITGTVFEKPGLSCNTCPSTSSKSPFSRPILHNFFYQIRFDRWGPNQNAMPFSANSLFAFSFLERCVRPMPRSTLGALVNWILS